MFCFSLRFGFFTLPASLLRSRIGLLLGGALMVGMLVGLPATARALQMPMASDIEKENAGQTDLVRANWLKFNPTGSRAEFKMPFKPRFVERTFTPVKGVPPIKVRMHIGTALDASVNFSFSYNDMNERPRGSKGITNTLEGVVRGSLTNVQGKLLNKTEIRLKGVKGRQFAYQFADKNDKQYLALSRAFVKDARIYQLSAVMGKDEFNESLAAEFLNSFRIVKAKPDLPPTPKTPKQSEDSPESKGSP